MFKHSVFPNSVGYEDFHFDAKEAYLEMDFNSFQVSTAAESSLLQMSFEDINVMDDASTKPAKDTAEPTKDDPKFGDNAPIGAKLAFYHFLRKLLAMYHYLQNK